MATMSTKMKTENQHIEFKRQLTDSLEKEAVAFLHYRDGGVIYIGVDDQGTALGLDDVDTQQLIIKDRLKHNITPSTMGLFDVVVETADNNKSIIKVTLASGSEKPYYLSKRGMSPKGCFIRVGSASEPMTSRMIEDLFARRIRNSIGNIASRYQDLSFEQLKIYYNETPYQLNDRFAHNLELLTRDGQYNYAAYLLSDRNGCSIKVAKYAGTTRVDLFSDRLEITSVGVIPAGFNEEDFFKGYSVPQNKELMRVFRDIDLVEHLGSGVPRILQTYTPAIYHFSPNFIRVTFPFAEGFQDTPQASDQVTMQAPRKHPASTPQEQSILQYCLEPKSRIEIQTFLNLKDREHFRKAILLPLIESGQLLLTLPDKPTSPKQQFYTAPETKGQGKQQ